MGESLGKSAPFALLRRSPYTCVIIYILYNNRVLRYLAVYKVKVLLILLLAIGLMAIRVYGCGLLRDKVVLVTVQEVSNLAI